MQKLKADQPHPRNYPAMFSELKIADFPGLCVASLRPLPWGQSRRAKRGIGMQICKSVESEDTF